MSKAYEDTAQFIPEIRALRRQVAKLKAVERRCRQAEATLKVFEERNRLLGDSAPLGILTIDARCAVTGINRRMREMLSWPAADKPELIRLTDSPGLTTSQFISDIRRCMDEKRPITVELPHTAPQGVCIHLRFYLSPIIETDGSPSGVMAIAEDYTYLKRVEQELRESEHRFRNQALRDDLTGLFNRRYLYQSLENLVREAKATDTSISLIFMDLDHFKQVVDTHGHLNGSRAIREVAGTIDNCLNAPAYAVAYAGDEFVVVLPGMDPAQALNKAADIRSRVRDTHYVLGEGIAVRLQASFGIATLPQHASEADGLIAAADRALFAIKAAGKDAVGEFHDFFTHD